MTIFGDGSQTRSFCYVDDLISGLIALMNSPREVTGPINLGNPHEISIETLAAMIIEMTGSSSEIINKSLPSDDPVQRQPDISLAETVLDWRPSVPVEVGLEATIEYFSRLLNLKLGQSV